jgi:ankyrin repeat protein
MYAQDSEGRTALHFACDRGQLAAVELLLKHNAAVNFADIDGQTPLHYAVTCDHPEVIVILVSCYTLHVSLPNTSHIFRWQCDHFAERV